MGAGSELTRANSEKSMTGVIFMVVDEYKVTRWTGYRCEIPIHSGTTFDSRLLMVRMLYHCNFPLPLPRTLSNVSADVA